MKSDTVIQLTQLANKFKHRRFNHRASEQRAKQLSLQTDQLYFNYSRNPINQQVINTLIQLAEKQQLADKIEALFAGKTINTSENRAAKHWLLRAPLNPKDQDSQAVHHVLEHMSNLVEQIHHHTLLEQPVTDIICLGIGGSELGPRLVCEALTMGRKKRLNIHFIANIDGLAVVDALANCSAHSTLFLVISKTFTTFETLTNYDTIKQWFCLQQGFSEALFYQRSYAITSNTKAASATGIPDKQIFTFWDWVGGRYSLWSAVGLPIAIACGMKTFRQLLAGAHAIDKHFQTASFDKNLPVILALLHTWYSDYLHYPTRAIIPYAENLKALPEYLQQLEMESLGKSVTTDGRSVIGDTSPIVWGSAGSNAQHAFFQLLHQGTQTVPVDFVAAEKPCDTLMPVLTDALDQQHNALLANALAQSRALITGGDNGHQGQGIFPGNRPSNFMLLEQINAYGLGQLIATYEHKVFVQSILWEINAFDQFGVELGKQMCQEILAKNPGKLTQKKIIKTFES